MLLSQIGLIHPFFREEGSDSFEILFPSEKLNEGLLVLDQTPAHEIMTIGVLYGRVGQSTIKQMLCNDSASPEFLTFVKNLGTEVGVEFCKSFSGGVTTQDVRTIHVHSDHTMDVFFHVPSLMICDYNRRRDLFLSNLVRVVWKEDPGVILLKKTFKLPKYLEMQLSKKDVEFPIIYIFIQPVGSRLYRIEIDDSSLIGKVANNLVVEHSSSFLQDRGASAWPRTGTLDGDKGGANDSFYLSGPLVNNCVVRDAMLPQLVRKTSINYMKRVLDQFADRLDPYSQRSKIIQSMCADHSSAAPTGVFYRSFFQHQLDDQLKKFIRH